MTVGTKTRPKCKYGQSVETKSSTDFRSNYNLRCKWAGIEILASDVQFQFFSIWFSYFSNKISDKSIVKPLI